MKSTGLISNAVHAILQFGISSVAIFFLYRFLLQSLGAEKLGVWSLVLASTSVSQFANLGLTGSVVKFVAKYKARQELDRVSLVVQTTLVSLSVVMAIVLVLLYPVAQYLLSVTIEHSLAPTALELLPVAFISVWLSAITTTILGVLDGIQRVDLRSYLMMSSTLIYVIISVYLVPTVGIVGLAYAQIIQYLVLATIGLGVIRSKIPLPLCFYRWDIHLFKEMFGYGTGIQVISLLSILFEPTTKFLLATFGSVGSVGYYEMANRMVRQYRGLLVSAAQVLLPTIAHISESSHEKINKIYIQTSQVMFFSAVPMFTLLVIAIPLISRLWIGHYEIFFITSSTLLVIAFAVNSITSPAHYTFLGIGDLQTPTIANIGIAVVNGVVGASLGFLFGEIGVVIGWCVALVIGSVFVAFEFNRIHKIPCSAIFDKHNFILLLACLGSLIVYSFDIRFFQNAMPIISPQLFLPFIVFSVLFVFAASIHPVSRQAIRWIQARFT